MITCPNCLHEEIVGSLFCTDCGTQLVFKDGVPTTTIKMPTDQINGEPLDKQASAAASSLFQSEGSTVSLTLLNAGKVIPLGDRKEATLGRISQGQPVIPDIDLTPYKAYEAGVSRMHASIKFKENFTFGVGKD